MLSTLLARVLPALPSRCAVCHAWPTEPVCEACVSQFGQPVARCQTCALPVHGSVSQCGACVLAPPPLDACIAAVSYDYPWTDLISHFKFHGQPGLARSLGRLMRSAPWVEPALEQADLVIPMPLSAPRLRERGFNQAVELAKQLAPTGRIESRLLLRIKDTAPQLKLNRNERLTNLNNAFAVEPLKAPCLKAARVVLLDDVMTSGASLHAAARALRGAGAGHITGIVFARTNSPEVGTD
ncbi:ComF family protein [Rhodoferax sp.]|uniref:ComF family protein n=1 Tax=Rhodoferax sp. TaxID=50421 RepID=UPI0027647E3A|nr:ComF family protein [Rhodoferax sp.]